jgi:hypothetical protein
MFAKFLIFKLLGLGDIGSLEKLYYIFCHLGRFGKNAKNIFTRDLFGFTG